MVPIAEIRETVATHFSGPARELALETLTASMVIGPYLAVLLALAMLVRRATNRIHQAQYIPIRAHGRDKT